MSPDDRAAEVFLDRFPGPVSIPVKRRKKLLSFTLCLGFTAFLAWLAFVDAGPQYRWNDWIMIPVSLAFFAAFTVRGLTMLLLPSIGSLTLGPEGFTIEHILWTERTAWRDVTGEVRADMTYGRGRVGGTLPVLRVERISPSPWRAAPRRGVRLLTDSFELPLEELARLMNEWRARALALAAVRRSGSSVPSIAPAPGA